MPVLIEKRLEVAVPYERIVTIEVPKEKVWPVILPSSLLFLAKHADTLTHSQSAYDPQIIYKDLEVPFPVRPERIVYKEVPKVFSAFFGQLSIAPYAPLLRIFLLVPSSFRMEIGV